MKGIRSRFRLRSWTWLLVVGAALRAAPAVAAVPPPSAPAASTGSYTVSYTRCTCTSDWLEERTEGGAWRVVGKGDVKFTGKAAGTYYYRVGYWWSITDIYVNYQWMEYSTEVRVVVNPNAPPIDSLETQLTYRYETRVGDANGDGRMDLFVDRTAGGQAGNGAIDEVLLLQRASGEFSARAPSASQSSAARAWPRAGIRLIARDFNVDGFADVLLKGVGAAVGLSSLADQIVYAPARVLSSVPLGVRAVDSQLKRFAADSREYFADSNYFVANAPLRVMPVVVFYYYCDPWPVSGDVYVSGYCDYFPYVTSVVAPDYSAFDEAALSAWENEELIETGSETLDKGQAAIKTAYEGALGVPLGGRDLSKILGERGSVDEPRYRRGLELFLAAFGIFDANADELEPKRESARRPDVVYVTGRKILGFLPRHTALEYGGATLSAHDSDETWLGDGRLVSQLNWPSDNPRLMMTLGTVSSSLGASAYWARLVSADGAYGDDLPYDAVPSVGHGGYNSNGYTRGLVLATAGVPSIDMSRFVGGERPVPAGEFR